MSFEPDYTNLVLAARNQQTKRIPLYEHSISYDLIAALSGENKEELLHGDASERVEFFRWLCGFHCAHGYDTLSFECMSASVMEHSGHLGGHGLPPGICTRADFDRYPWAGVTDAYFEYFTPRFEALREALPPGMKAVGGVGYGVFELTQDLVGFEDLCYMLADDEELFRDLINKVGETLLRIWTRLLREFGDIFCVCRFGDDLGYKASTLFSAETLRKYIFPHYGPIIRAVHTAGKPFLLHSCGNIFEVMEDIIATGIDAKHSNEDAIAPFGEWIERYGTRIGNFGGIDTDALCRMDEVELKEDIKGILKQCENKPGIAFGSGNSITPYVPPENFLVMTRVIRGLD